jgi:hypothetical protein
MDTQIDPIAIASSLVWLACAIVCILKGKLGMAIIGFIAAIAIAVWTLPPIGGYYILNVLYPISFIPIWGAIRLAHPESYWAYWFYRKNPRKYMRAVLRFGMVNEYLELQGRAEKEAQKQHGQRSEN